MRLPSHTEHLGGGVHVLLISLERYGERIRSLCLSSGVSQHNLPVVSWKSPYCTLEYRGSSSLRNHPLSISS